MEEPEEALAEDAECVVELDAAADSEEAEEAEGGSEEAEEEEEEEEAAAAAATAEVEVESASEEEEEELLEDAETEERSWPVPVVICRRVRMVSGLCVSVVVAKREWRTYPIRQSGRGSR